MAYKRFQEYSGWQKARILSVGLLTGFVLVFIAGLLARLIVDAFCFGFNYFGLWPW